MDCLTPNEKSEICRALVAVPFGNGQQALPPRIFATHEYH